jgi:hypothetical protein
LKAKPKPPPPLLPQNTSSVQPELLELGRELEQEQELGRELELELGRGLRRGLRRERLRLRPPVMTD